MIIIALIFFIIISLIIMYNNKMLSKEEIIIVIDAGHGGSNIGAVSPSGILERDINLAIAKYIKKELEDKYKVILTRNDDDYISPRKRVEIAEQSNATLILSIHQNSYENNCSKGGSEFYQNNRELRSLGFSIQDSLNKKLNFSKRQEQKSQDFSIFKTDIPTILFEVNFICNENIAKILNKSENQEKIAQIIADEIYSYLNKGTTTWKITLRKAE